MPPACRLPIATAVQASAEPTRVSCWEGCMGAWLDPSVSEASSQTGSQAVSPRSGVTEAGSAGAFTEYTATSREMNTAT